MSDDDNRFSDAREVRFRRGTFTINGSLSESNKLDFYQVKLSGRSNFSCLLNGLKGNADLTLYDVRRREITASEEDDDDDEGISRQLGAGTYFIRINRIESNTSYKLKITSTADAGDSFRQSFKIRPGKEKFKGKFIFKDRVGEDDDDTDFYQFNLSDRSTCQTILSGLGDDADLELFNSSRQRIFFSAKGGKRSEQINQILDAGIYFIKVKIKSEVKTTYNLSFSFTSLKIDLGDDDLDTARPIVINPSLDDFDDFDDFVGVADPEDFYRVNLTSPSNLNLTLNGLSADANLELLNSSGTVLSSSINTGTTQELINLNLTAGSYFVRIFPATPGTSTPYKLDFAIDPLRLFGVTDTNTLVAFNADKVDKALGIPVTGLATGESLRGIDFRPATGTLYGLSTASKLYTINLETGAVTTVSASAITPAPTGTAYGVDFNPVVDRLRVVSDADENLRLDPFTGAITGTDTVLTYAAGDANTAANPAVTASAYTNNLFGITSTTLFGIDTTLNVLVRQGSNGGIPVSPNAGTLNTVGALGVDILPTAGFDIFTDLTLTNTAYATSGATLYTINLTTGAATSVGTVSVAPLAGTTPPPAGTTPPPATPLNLIGLAARPQLLNPIVLP